MSALPFSDFLELLRAKGLGVGLHEHMAVARLLAHWDSTNRTHLRDALAALVARHEDEAHTIRQLFDVYYPASTGDDSGPVPDTAARGYPVVRLLRSRLTWAATIAGFALICGAIVADRYLASLATTTPPASPFSLMAGIEPLPSPGIDDLPLTPDPVPQAASGDPVVPETLVQVAEDPPSAPLPPPPSHLNWLWLAMLAATTLALSLVALWGRRMHAHARAWTLDAWKKALVALPGPYHTRLVLRDLQTRLPRRDVEDAATLLARAFSGVGRSQVLDVPRSLQHTLRTGLRPQLVFKPRRVQQSILVLQDVSQMMRAHAARVEHLIVDLRRQGVRLERWYFDGDVSIAARRPQGPPVRLDVLAKRYEDRPVMIVSSGLGLNATLTLTDQMWLGAFRTWTRRVWLSPIRDPRLWPTALARLPICALPMTRAGLMQAARLLAVDHYAVGRVPGRAGDAPPHITAEHVETLRRLASVVPYPTVEELELLRQRFASEVPEAAVLHAATGLGSYEGEPIRMSDGDIRSHLAALRRDTPALEPAIRQYLLKVLADSEPVAGSAAHLRWQLSTTLHEVQLATSDGTDATPALAALAALAHGPLWRELRDAVERMGRAGRDAGSVRKAAGLDGAGATEPPAFEDRTGLLTLEPFRWCAPRWQDAALALLIGGLVASTASATDALRIQSDHRPDAYLLEYQTADAATSAGLLRVRPRDPGSDVPGRVQIYRDGVPVEGSLTIDDRTTGATVPLPGGTGVHVYQARAGLGDQAFALSNTLWAPSVLITIDAQPWANVTVRSVDGLIPEMTQATPAALRLPEGQYDLSLENDGLTSPLTTRISVSNTGNRVFRYDMPGFNAGQLLDDLGLDEPVRALRD